MVKHIVMYRLKDGVDKSATVERISALLEPLVGKIPGLLWLEVNETFQGDVDYVLYSEFESVQSLELYRSSSLHQEAKAQFEDCIASRFCGDYEF